MNKDYIEFITGLKQNIIQSRYIATRLVNREQLLLYFKTGKMLTDKLEAKNWGAKVVRQIADDLQKALPGLRGFSYRNLMNMKKLSIHQTRQVAKQLCFNAPGKANTICFAGFSG